MTLTSKFKLSDTDKVEWACVDGFSKDSKNTVDSIKTPHVT